MSKKILFSAFFIFLTVNLFSNPTITSDEIVFKYKNAHAKSVKVLFSIDKYKTMYYMEKENGVWTLRLNYSRTRFQLKPGRYLYRFIVDNVYISDPNNSKQIIDPFVGRVSYFDITKRLIAFNKNPQKIGPLTYRFYFQNTEGTVNIKEIMLVGSFNNWRPYEYFFKKSSKDIWYIDFKFEKEGVFYYQYVINGRWKRDFANPEQVYNRLGEAYSLVKVEK